jgi:pyridoxal phosphate enzyme (YggS family)
MINNKMTRGVSAGALAAVLSACGHLPIAEPAFEAMADKRAGLPTDWTVGQMTGDTTAIVADYSVFQDAQLIAYVQEALDKIGALADLRGHVEWHLIGPLQSNKTRPVAAAFDWVHSVDRLKIAQRLAEQRPPGLPPLQLCLQVNISGEASKSGLLPAEVLPVARAVAALPAHQVRLRGLMAIPEPAGTLDEQRRPHRALAELLATLQAHGLTVDTLSMGMSADLEAAVAEGATVVRVGTAIFGGRPPA